MSKKVLVIIALAVVIAVSGGVVTYMSTTGGGRSADPTSAETLPNENVQNDNTQNDILPSETDQTDDARPTSSSGSGSGDSYGYADALIQAGTYRIARVVDHVEGGDASAREVFGKLYSYCSLAFYDDGSFDLCINPTSGEIRRGTYQIYGDVIAVVYDNGAGSEFDVISNDYNEIVYIVVNYGDYDVYFSNL